MRNYRTGLFRIARFAHGLGCLEVMTDTWFSQSEVSEQGLVTGPVIAFPMAATVEPLQEYRLDVIKVRTQALEVTANTVIIPVSPQFPVEFSNYS